MVNLGNMSRKCSVCNKTKKSSEFHSEKESRCILCKRTYMVEYRHNLKEENTALKELVFTLVTRVEQLEKSMMDKRQVKSIVDKRLQKHIR